jgi:hypothetical protein
MALMVPWESWTPKHHVVYHMLLNTGFHGNPELYANWEDEALNKMLKACCRYVSQLRFEESCLLRMRSLLKARGQKRTRQ